MATPAQAAAATVGAGSLAAAGAYGITQAVNGAGEETNTEEQETTDENNEIPSNVSVFAGEDVSKEPYTGKLISFIKQANLSSLVKPEDQKWWDWAFKNKYEKLKVDNQVHNLFVGVNSSETLKTACQQAYTQDKSEYLFGDTDYLLENISTFCTKGKEKQDVSEPKAEVYQTASADTTYKNGVLGITENAAILVKKEEGTNNDLWWKWAFKNLFKKVSETKTETFNSVNKGFSSSADDSSNKYLNNACDTAYKKTYTDLKPTGTEISKLLKEIKKFCSINNTEETPLSLPEPAEPKAINAQSSEYQTDQSLGKKTENRTHLINPKETNNQNWWEWSYTTRYPKNNSSLPDPFKNLTQGYEAINGTVSGTVTSLNKACHLAYEKKNSELGTVGEDNSLIEVIKKFCTRNITTTALSLP